MPSLDGGDNFVWIGDPFEGFGMGVVIVEEAIDRGTLSGCGPFGIPSTSHWMDAAIIAQ